MILKSTPKQESSHIISKGSLDKQDSGRELRWQEKPMSNNQAHLPSCLLKFRLAVAGLALKIHIVKEVEKPAEGKASRMWVLITLSKCPLLALLRRRWLLLEDQTGNVQVDSPQANAHTSDSALLLWEKPNVPTLVQTKSTAVTILSNLTTHVQICGDYQTYCSRGSQNCRFWCEIS